VVGPGDAGSRLAGHVTPCHAIESMWFVAEQSLAHGRPDAVAHAARVTAASFAAGWDPEHGGLFRYVVPGPDGPQPRGEPSGAFERLIVETWDGKIWGPHSEALDAARLALAALDAVGGGGEDGDGP